MVYVIGFTVLKRKILSGEKRQTIRLVKKRRPPRIGETLRLYWHLRRKDCELLKEAVCVYSMIWRWKDMKDDVELARLDGFNGLKDFREWFDRYKPDDETKFMVIRW